MCGRFTLTADYATLFERFAVLGKPPVKFRPRYNAAPSQELPVIVESNGKRRMLNMRWGLIPSWAKDPKIGNRLINARCETVETKPSFRAAYKRHRCLVPVDGFYEWKNKQPHRFILPGEKPFGLAGLWETWHGPDGPVRSFTILTTDANALVGQVHHRMPVILHRRHENAWLHEGSLRPDLAAKILLPYSGKMGSYPVSKHLNSSAADEPEMINPLE